MVTLEYVFDGSIPLYTVGNRVKRWHEECGKTIDEIGRPSEPIPICVSIQIRMYFVLFHPKLNNSMWSRGENIINMLTKQGIITSGARDYKKCPNISVQARRGTAEEGRYCTVTIMYDDTYRFNKKFSSEGLPVIARR